MIVGLSSTDRHIYILQDNERRFIIYQGNELITVVISECPDDVWSIECWREGGGG